MKHRQRKWEEGKSREVWELSRHIKYLRNDNWKKSPYAIIENEEKAIRDKTGEVSKGNI